MNREANAPMQTSLHIWIDGRRHVLRTLNDAVVLVRGIQHPLTEYCELLVDQIEAAASPDLQARAWRAITTWIEAVRATAPGVMLHAA